MNVAKFPTVLAALLAGFGALVAFAPLASAAPRAETPASASAVTDRVPEPSRPFWLDPDPAASHMPLPDNVPLRMGQRHRLRAIERGMRRYPDHPQLLAERGFIRHQIGQHDAAEADYSRALQLAGIDILLRRHVLWSQGWARFEAGRDEAALASWRESVALHGGRPYWFPYSAALAEWRLGRRDEAVALYAEAVRGMPEWGRESGLLRRTSHWPQHQFAVAGEVFQAWKATRP